MKKCVAILKHAEKYTEDQIQQVGVLTAFFEHVIRDHTLDEGVHEVIKVSVAFAEEELPL
jgi:chemotaxis regulatin CheY-phosphate phosphatase CheZ